jgi:hypothetical protein
VETQPQSPPLPTSSPPKRRRARVARIALGLLLLLFTVPMLAWLAGIAVALCYSGFVLAYESTSGVYPGICCCWVTPQSTVVRTASGGLTGGPRDVLVVEWSRGASTVATGHTHYESPYPGVMGLEITHALAMPILLLTTLLLAILARRCLARARRGAGQCPSCGYSTVGLQSPTCPECGRGVAAANG